MKKLFCLMCIAVMLVSCSALAKELPEIDFQGIKLGSTAAEVDASIGKGLNRNPANNYTYYRTRDMAKSVLGDSYTDDEIFADKLILITDTFASDGVAGYECYSTRLFYVRPIKDGTIEDDDTKSVFYAGVYSISSAEKASTVTKDLTKKLTSLYGKVKKEGEVSIWYGADNTAVILGESPYGTVQLVYAYLNGDTMYEDGIALLSTSTQDISDNTSGL